MKSVVVAQQVLTHCLRPQVSGMVGVRWLCEVTGEARLTSLLRQHFPGASEIQVQDISGGCGAMYEVWVEDTIFKGLSTVKQHRLITQTLKAEIQDMHGLRITTSIPGKT